MGYLSWASYLFPNLRGTDALMLLPTRTVQEVERGLSEAKRFWISDSEEGGFPHGTRFFSYQYWATKPMSNHALLAGFLMLWLKRCVIPSPPHDAIAGEVVYPAVLLAFGVRLALLPAMVADIQAGLRQWGQSLMNREKDPRIDMPYTYLVAWYVMHCPLLMHTPTPDSSHVPFVQRLERSNWLVELLPSVRVVVAGWSNYSICPCFVRIPGGSPKMWFGICAYVHKLHPLSMIMGLQDNSLHRKWWLTKSLTLILSGIHLTLT